MKWLDAMLGRTKAKAPDLDALFAVSNAAVTLEAAVGLRPLGEAAVAFKAASGQAFAEIRNDLVELIRFSEASSGTRLSSSEDRFGYGWLTLSDPDLEDLVTTVHLANATLSNQGFGGQLLCSLFGFGNVDGATCHLVYLYKRGTFYPFAPRDGERRDNELELRVRGAVAGELPFEDDLSRWFPLWGVPLADDNNRSN